MLAERFAAHGFPEVRPAYGSILIPLYEEDGLRIGELARRARLSKQAMTALIRRLERDGLVERDSDPADARAAVISLTPRAREFAPIAAAVLTELDGEVAALLTPQELAAVRSALPALADVGRSRTDRGLSTP